MEQLKEVTVVESPVTKRYVQPGSIGHIDHKKSQIRVGGVWHSFDTERGWIVVTEEEKPASFVESLLFLGRFDNFVADEKFNRLIEAYAIDEDTAMQWMINSKKFDRNYTKNGWIIKKE